MPGPMFIDLPQGRYITIPDALRIIRMTYPDYTQSNLYDAAYKRDREGGAILESIHYKPPTGGVERLLISYDSFKEFVNREGFGRRSKKLPQKRRKR